MRGTVAKKLRKKATSTTEYRQLKKAHVRNRGK